MPDLALGPAWRQSGRAAAQRWARLAIGRRPALPEDGIFRTILWVLVITVVAGGAVTLAGEYVYHSEAMVTVGTGAALIAGGIYFVFRWLGRREARRREAAATGHERPERLED
jgi:hypothetical protein